MLWWKQPACNAVEITFSRECRTWLLLRSLMVLSVLITLVVLVCGGVISVGLKALRNRRINPAVMLMRPRIVPLTLARLNVELARCRHSAQ